MSAVRYWLIKSEPGAYPFSALQRDKTTAWTGVRNFEARNNIRQMSPGDLALYYHSGDGKEIVGVARVASEPGPDDTVPGEDWASVDMEAVVALSRPVNLAQVKSAKQLADFPLVRRSRLSVAPVTPEHFQLVLKLASTRLP
jgi:predicted RNA-binding protein with PUA-like domain